MNKDTEKRIQKLFAGAEVSLMKIVDYLSQTDFEIETYTFQDNIKVNIYDDLYIDFLELDLGI